jgi:Flp pilus assembly protein TadG
MHVRSRIADQRGTAIVEMALALPILLVMVLGALDLGRAVYTRNMLANAARDGARFAAIDPNNSTCIKTVASRIGAPAGLTSSDVSISFPSGVDIDQPVRVTVTKTYTPVNQMLAKAIGASTVPLKAESTMQITNIPWSAQTCPAPATSTPTSIPPTATIPTTATPTGAATSTSVATLVPSATATTASTATAVPPTATGVPPTATPVPPTATAVPPTATRVPPTATTVPPTATVAPPTATPIPATATATPCVGPPGQCKR